MRSGRKTRDGEEKEGRRKGRQKAAGWLEPAEEWAEQLRHKGYILRRLVPWLPRNTTIRGAERWFAFCLRSVSLRKEYDSHCISISNVSRNGAKITGFQILSKNQLCISWPVLVPMVTYDSSANTIAD